MSDKRTGELLETYDEIIEDFDRRCGLYEDTKEQVAEIRALIEHGPEVDGAFIRQLAGELSTYNFTDKHQCEVSALLTKRFIEHGIRIREEEKS